MSRGSTIILLFEVCPYHTSTFNFDILWAAIQYWIFQDPCEDFPVLFQAWELGNTVHLMFVHMFLQKHKVPRVPPWRNNQTITDFSHFNGISKGHLTQQLAYFAWARFGGASYAYAASLVAVLAAQLPDFVALEDLFAPCVVQQQRRFHHGSFKNKTEVNTTNCFTKDTSVYRSNVIFLK